MVNDVPPTVLLTELRDLKQLRRCLKLFSSKQVAEDRVIKFELECHRGGDRIIS